MHNFQKQLSPDDKRYGAFSFLADILASDPNSLVIETGSIRILNNWKGDGQSTRIWSEAAQQVISIDISPTPENLIRQLNLSNVKFYAADSMIALRYLKDELKETTLLYLDSLDYEGKTKYLSELHHAAELRLCYEHLPSGAYIAVDDCHSDTEGKHVLVKAFFDRQSIKPVYTGYITIWRKP